MENQLHVTCLECSVAFSFLHIEMARSQQHTPDHAASASASSLGTSYKPHTMLAGTATSIFLG